jgi:hypothetical protein
MSTAGLYIEPAACKSLGVTLSFPPLFSLFPLPLPLPVTTLNKYNKERRVQTKYISNYKYREGRPDNQSSL